MTYANECIEMQDRAKRKTLKRIDKHTVPELNAAIETARRKFGDDFWMLLHAIDAYQERRKRRDAHRDARRSMIQLAIRGADDFEPLDVWGGN